MNKVVVTGVTGMDGSVISRKLLDKGFKVYGVVRQSASKNYWRLQEQQILNHPNFELKICDINDSGAVFDLINQVKPDWCLNFAAMSEVGTSFNLPVSTIQTDAMGPVYFLEAIRQFSPTTKFYTASSSEMFGNSKNKFGVANETTPLVPVSPYAAAKSLAHDMVRIYRESYGIFSCAGILFNHSCEYRGDYFVEKKICKYVARLKYGMLKSDDDYLYLGNLDASRDIGSAYDYMEGVILMMESQTPDDYVLCTGRTHTIRDIVELAFSLVGESDWKSYVKIDSNFKRPNELHVLLGDNNKARRQLNWYPSYTLIDILQGIIDFEFKQLETVYPKDLGPICIDNIKPGVSYL